MHSLHQTKQEVEICHGCERRTEERRESCFDLFHDVTRQMQRDNDGLYALTNLVIWPWQVGAWPQIDVKQNPIICGCTGSSDIRPAQLMGV